VFLPMLRNGLVVGEDELEASLGLNALRKLLIHFARI
jgi:hypothetical protein